MTLLKTSILNALAVVIKMLTLLGLNKILAIYVGPEGYAMIGQFQNAIQVVTTFGSGTINTGVTKYTAEYKAETDKQHLVWRTAGTLALCSSLLSGVAIAIFSEPLSSFFLHDAKYADVFVWFSVFLTLFSFNTLLLSILNGKKEIRLYITANIFGSLFSFFITSILAVSFGLHGALIALAIYQSFSFVVTLYFCSKCQWFDIRYLFGGVDLDMAVNLGKFALMALSTAICVPVSQMLIRGHLVEVLGLEYAGYWEAMLRLSLASLMFITTTLSVYYLPRFAELKDYRAIDTEVFKGYAVILPISFTLCVAMYLLQDYIIKLLFTPSFLVMKDLFAFQMLGNFFQMGSWFLGMLFLSKTKFKVHVFIQMFFSFFYVLLSYYFIEIYGFQGVAIAHAVNYLVCFVFSFIVYFQVRQEFITKTPKRIVD